MLPFERTAWNVWLLSLPFIAFAVSGFNRNPNVAKRMADMSGYTLREKIYTVSASLTPYPLLIATIWTPFTDSLPLLISGMALYIPGIILFEVTLRTIIKTPQNEPFSAGPYRISRNPLYVAATLVFAGICAVSASISFAGYLIVATWLQHSMILAEERICRQKYSEAFETYLKSVPRYLFRIS